MTKDEFIILCQVCGYASKKNAKAYAKGKEKLTEDDLAEVHRINERKLDLEKPWAFADRGYTGDLLIEALGVNPKPWNHIFDANRGMKELKKEV